MKKLLIITLLVLTSSCATVLTKKVYPLKVRSGSPGDSVEINHIVYSLPATIPVRRSKEDLTLTLISDTVARMYTVKSSPNPTFIYANLLWMQVCPAAYLVDFTNQKRFYYGRSVFLDKSDTVSIIKPRPLRKFDRYITKTYPVRTGQINLSLSVPYINHFYLKPDQEPSKRNTGFFGFSAGFEYYYRDHRYLSLTGNVATDFFMPFPAAVDLSGAHEVMYSTYVSLADNFKLNRFHLGYGINYSWNAWQLMYEDSFDPQPPSREPVKRLSQSAGVTLNAYHQITKHLFAGVIYRPTILTTAPATRFEYEHLISIDVAWKVGVKNR